MAKIVDPQAYAEKWARRTGQATQDYVAGVQGVQTAPGQQAAAQQATYLARVNESAGKWARNVAGVSLQDWKDKTVNVGAARISSGVTAAQSKMAAVASQLLPAVAAAAAASRAMPKQTLDQRIQRSVAFQQAMSKFQKR